MHLYCAPIPFKMICHVLGNKIGSHLIWHAFMSSTCCFFCRSSKMHLFRCPVFVASSGIGRWVDVNNDRFGYLYRIAGKDYSLTIFACFLSLTPPIFLFLASHMLWCLCPDPICMFTWQPWYSHTSTSYYMLFVYLVSLASPSAGLGALLQSCYLFYLD